MLLQSPCGSGPVVLELVLAWAPGADGPVVDTVAMALSPVDGMPFLRFDGSALATVAEDTVAAGDANAPGAIRSAACPDLDGLAVLDLGWLLDGPVADTFYTAYNECPARLVPRLAAAPSTPPATPSTPTIPTTPTKTEPTDSNLVVSSETGNPAGTSLYVWSGGDLGGPAGDFSESGDQCADPPEGEHAIWI